jgi:hypothetical protein
MIFAISSHERRYGRGNRRHFAAGKTLCMRAAEEQVGVGRLRRPFAFM